MVYGCPTRNLSQYSGIESKQNGSAATRTAAEIFIGPLSFASSSHVRMNVF